MEQASNVRYRAEKVYKNSREKFGYLIREVVSNAIHAVIIRKRIRQHEGYTPKVSFSVDHSETSIVLTITDNGDGFTELNRHNFSHLDFKNIEKDKLHFHPQGQGRLAIVYFSDRATYSSIYIDKSGNKQKREFDYPEATTTLFDLEAFECYPTDEAEIGTTLQIRVDRQHSLGRANTFFSKYPDTDKLQSWFVEHFFPFFMEDDGFELTINYNGNGKAINKQSIERDVQRIPFSVHLGTGIEPTNFTTWLISKPDRPKTKNQVRCYARHLSAELDGAKIEYEIDIPNAYDWILTSDFFDDNVDEKGDKLQIDCDTVAMIQEGLNVALDSHFAAQIEKCRKATKRNIDSAKAKFHSLSIFIDHDKECETKRILGETDIVNRAVEIKGKIEKAYWASPTIDNEETNKLINSSLHIYIDHRNRILQRFMELIRRFDDSGVAKKEPEDDVHDLFLRRGENLKNTDNVNHLHNLWILDDKFTIFSETFQAKSTKRGQGASDIYMWTDDPEKTRELLILELKSTSVAHNAGDKYESMVSQIRRYAAQFYHDPQKMLNWHTDPDKIMYTGIILARKSDVYKEINSNNSGSSPEKIPFLESSYYFNEKFAIEKDPSAEPKFKKIRIEMYSYEDMYQLASARNNVFFKLLKGEFGIAEEDSTKDNQSQDELPEFQNSACE